MALPDGGDFLPPTKHDFGFLLLVSSKLLLVSAGLWISLENGFSLRASANHSSWWRYDWLHCSIGEVAERLNAPFRRIIVH